MSPIARLALAGALVAAPAAAWAHHGWSSYNEAEPVTLSGPLKDVVWGNPHGTAKMNWQDKEWDVVLAPVTRMTARGLTLEEIDKGQRVTLTGYVRRDGTPEMRIERIKVGDKTVELR
ncbi:MAG TPA: DUF6152 family protein [Croceibacterium sp.]|nr:DUF6152 family protein [Croceibacterium sp.]